MRAGRANDPRGWRNCAQLKLANKAYCPGRGTGPKMLNLKMISSSHSKTGLAGWRMPGGRSDMALDPDYHQRGCNSQSRTMPRETRFGIQPASPRNGKIHPDFIRMPLVASSDPGTRIAEGEWGNYLPPSVANGTCDGWRVSAKPLDLDFFMDKCGLFPYLALSARSRDGLLFADPLVSGLVDAFCQRLTSARELRHLCRTTRPKCYFPEEAGTPFRQGTVSQEKERSPATERGLVRKWRK